MKSNTKNAKIAKRFVTRNVDNNIDTKYDTNYNHDTGTQCRNGINY